MITKYWVPLSTRIRYWIAGKALKNLSFVKDISIDYDKKGFTAKNAGLIIGLEEVVNSDTGKPYLIVSPHSNIYAFDRFQSGLYKHCPDELRGIIEIELTEFRSRPGVESGITNTVTTDFEGKIQSINGTKIEAK